MAVAACDGKVQKKKPDTTEKVDESSSGDAKEIEKSETDLKGKNDNMKKGEESSAKGKTDSTKVDSSKQNPE